jgi:hypothetical protein
MAGKSKGAKIQKYHGVFFGGFLVALISDNYLPTARVADYLF